MQPVPADAGWHEADYYCWGGKAVVAPGELGPETVHFIGARWPRWSGFLGWLLRSEVCRAVSRSQTGPFVTQEVLLGPRSQTKADGSYYWDQHNIHNPTLMEWGDQLCLFYTGSQHDPAHPLAPLERPMGEPTMPEFYEIGAYGWPRMHQRVGVATADSPLGPWRRMDESLLEPDEAWAPWFTTNPSACVGPDGRVYLYYKSIDPVHKRMKLGVASADRPEGPYTKFAGNPVINPGDHHHVEDHHVWLQDGRFHMILKDITGGIGKVPNATLLLTSDDGFHWDTSQAVIIFTPGWPTSDGWHSEHRMEQANVLLRGGRPAVLYASHMNVEETACPHHPHHFHYRGEGELRTGNIAVNLRW